MNFWLIASLSATTLTVTAVGCVSPTRDIRRSALVPHATPIQRTGQPMGQTILEGALRADTVARTGRPTSGNDDEGVALPRHQYQVGGRFHVPGLDLVDFGVSYQHAMSRNATSLVDQPVPDGDAETVASTVHASLPLGDEGLRVGLAAEVAIHSIPYLLYQQCVSGCGGIKFESVTEHRDLVPGVAAAVVPSYRHGPVSFFGGVTLRTHPTIDRQEFVTGVGSDPGGPEPGGFVAILSGGVEAHLPHGLRAGITVHQTTFGGPAKYRPTVGASLTIPLVRSGPASPPPRLAAQ